MEKNSKKKEEKLHHLVSTIASFKGLDMIMIWPY